MLVLFTFLHHAFCIVISSVNSFLVWLAEEFKHVESHFSISLSLSPLSKNYMQLLKLCFAVDNVGCFTMLQTVINAVYQLGDTESLLYCLLILLLSQMNMEMIYLYTTCI